MDLIYIYVTLSIYIFKNQTQVGEMAHWAKSFPRQMWGTEFTSSNHPKAWWAWPMICNLRAQEAETRVLEEVSKSK